jgi:hypothetical protein
VLYRVLFHYFDRFVAEYESRFEKEYGFFRPVVKEVVECYLDCGGTMKLIAFITDYQAVDRIINHLKLTFTAAKPPPARMASQELLIAAEAGAEYFS